MGEAVIVRTREAWARQADDALAALNAKAAGLPLREYAELDRKQFSLLIEALVALGGPNVVTQELKDLAGLRPVREVLGL